ncbi:hypothetical protein [Fructobacillus evanidus]|uniref:Uncharacterized protein n=1 Tax=Fructobacillus evanidus TaxID=3064281 RepID=A0ABM9MW82_9LACO|nr:unnamed protein product [Fructobacillus sp. LMG 32999]CAK1229472.1 unnamed protein product [Fructobacillus sp. LMG 32999]CAK1232280.1 unnamed protein product [Fructobacillus sp. LMG 32999]CAK1232421.1 unnamed protein product [Fructobacillus sp. LMG 32999]CAK1233533.1 unnamed protein product [Fructobacillus sp. LMG 32999]
MKNKFSLNTKMMLGKNSAIVNNSLANAKSLQAFSFMKREANTVSPG